jgi:hypothetical protein
MNIFAKEKKQIILRREDLVKNTGLLSKELSKLFFGNTHFIEHYHFPKGSRILLYKNNQIK